MELKDKMLNEDNIEIWLLRYKEGELNATETAIVEKALEKRADWRELADLYDPQLKLTPDLSVSFSNKQKLHFETQQKAPRKIIPLWSKISAAACIALLIGIGMRWMFTGQNQTSNTGSLIAKNQDNIENLENLECLEKLENKKSETIGNPVNRENREKRENLESPESPDNLEKPDNLQINKSENPVNLTNKLIVYLDDDVQTTDFKFSDPQVIITDKLITYYEEQEEIIYMPQRNSMNRLTDYMMIEVQLASLQIQSNIMQRIAGK